MAPNDSAQTTEEAGDLSARRRKAARYVVPVAVAGVAAATIGLVPALAASGDPKLPEISAQELIEKIAASDTEQLSGTVKISTDLGIPDFGGLADSFAPGAGGGGGEPGAEEGGPSASPDGKLMELATGSHTLRVAVDGPEKQKVSILEKAAEYSLIRNGDEVWAYDSGTNQVYHAEDTGSGHGRNGSKDGTGNGSEDGGAPDRKPPGDLPATPKDFADQALKAAGDTTSVSVDGTARVAGRSAYQLVIKPKQSGSTVDSIRVAVDSKTGTPLKFTVIPSGGGKAAIDVGFTTVDFSRPAASTFDFSPPRGAKVTEADELEKQAPGGHEKIPSDAFKGGGLPGGSEGLNVLGEGWTAIAKFESPGGKGLTPPKDGELPAAAEGFLDSLGDPVSGKFGSGTVFKTRLVNALMTDDGTVYVGAVTKDALVKAANADK
ncbi:outer membrane lipoprotein carrier protein LolA [Streptomyces sp. NPDC051018]|uniref:outer membrane lipoprotein carrier protein LolA n=1 Tax=Streptomyces sp. NPDC051018 TaxID=3365639 RepID=UPI0037A5F915